MLKMIPVPNRLSFATAVLVAASGIAGCASSASISPDAPSGAAPEAAAPVTPAVPTFTTDQVAAGQEAFASVCSDCHSVSEFRGSDFQFRFRRRTAWNLYTILNETMPEDAPGSLSAGTYVAIVSYVLQLNGYEAGASELPPTEDALRQLPLDGLPTTSSGL